MSDRDQFEAHWCRDVPSIYLNAALAEAKANRDGDRYKRDEVQWAWEAWQASRRAALEEAIRATSQSKTTSHACDAIRAIANGDTHE